MELKSLRFINVFKFMIVLDMIVQITLWIIGAELHFERDELDQMVKFSFTESIFDIILLSAFKTIILFVIVDQLELSTIKIASDLVEFNRLSDVPISTNTNDDEALINTTNANIPDSVSRKKSLKKFLHIFALLISGVSFVYSSVKFSLVLKKIIYSQNNNTNLPMHYFYFSALVTELGFSIIQLLFAALSWRFMRKLALTVQTQCLTSNSEKAETSKKNKKVNLKRLIGISYPERYYISIAFIMLVISSITNIIVPSFFGSVVDSATNYPDLKEMNKYVIYMFLVFLVGSIAGGIRSWLFEFAGQRVVARLRLEVFKAIIRQDIEFFDTNRTGELTSRLSSDTQVLQNAVTVNISMLARYLIQIAGSIALMLTLEPSLTGLLIGVVPIVSLLTVQYGRYLRKLRKQFQDELASSSVIAEETISSARTVRSFAAEDKMALEYQKNVNKSFLIGKKLAYASGGFMGFVGILSAGALALVLWYGGKLVHDKKITTGVLAAFLMYTLQVAMAFAFLSSLYGDFMQALGASQRIFELIDKESKIPSKRGVKPNNDEEDDKTFDGSLSFNEINFSYPTRSETKVLKNITFQIEKGKTIALVGPSGGGKSTIFSLIERFYDPDSGEIKLNPSSIDLKSVDTDWLHNRIALVSQEPILFGGTIKENIQFGLNEDVNMDSIIEVSKLANAYEFINTLENGFDTIVGERGIRLSGGQKQRIAIARALLMNPKLLLLDEATSALDSESEHLVQEAIDRAMKGRTVCVIAHRLSTVRNADKVLVVDKGSIVEQGTHDQLCQLDGIYKRLVLRQLLIKDPNATEETVA